MSAQSSRFAGRGRVSRGRGDASSFTPSRSGPSGRINPRASYSSAVVASAANSDAPLISSSNLTEPQNHASRTRQEGVNDSIHEKSTEHKRDTPLPASGIPYGHVPSFLPGSASLVEQLDRRLLIVLRDGRHLIGVR